MTQLINAAFASGKLLLSLQKPMFMHQREVSNEKSQRAVGTKVNRKLKLFMRKIAFRRVWQMDFGAQSLGDVSKLKT